MLRCIVQDELDDILRYGAAELFADAVAASKTKAEEAVTAGQCLRLLVSCHFSAWPPIPATV